MNPACPSGDPAPGPGAKPDDGPLSSPIDRRSFLAASGAVTGAAMMAHFTGRIPGPGPIQPVVEGGIPKRPTPKVEPGYPVFSDSDISFFIQVERDTDLAVIDFVFYNFSFGADPRLGRPAFLPIPGPDINTNSVLLVRFPPQAIGEGAYIYPASKDPHVNPTLLSFDPPPILSAVSGPSQLAFLFNAANGDFVSVPNGTTADLLDPGQWQSWNLSVPPVAQVQLLKPQPPYYLPVPEAPGAFDTFIEFPYAMYLAPTQWQAPFIPELPTLGFSTVFENTSLVNPSNNVGDLFTTRIVGRALDAQAPVLPYGDADNFTNNELDQPLQFATLWCDDLSLNPVVYESQILNATPNPSVPPPPYLPPLGNGTAVLPLYEKPYDVTYWEYIQYGAPLPPPT